MSDAALVATISGGFVLATAVVQIVAVRINSRQHGASAERLERIEDSQKKTATELLDHREKSQEYRDLQTTRHEENVGCLAKIDQHLEKVNGHLEKVNGHVKALDKRVKHLEGDHP